MFEPVKVHPSATGPVPAEKIGYKSPPKYTRFQKGRSGNPKGRKKREMASDLRTLFERILIEERKIREGGRVRTVTTLEAIMRAVSNSALVVNPKMVRRLLSLAARMRMLTKRPLDADLPYTLVFPRDAKEEAALAKYRAEKTQKAQQLLPEENIKATRGAGSADERRS